jgi:hypothetical protein
MSKSKFERFEDHGEYWLVRHTETRIFHVSWYDSAKRQTRRRSLDTTSSAAATKEIERLIREGIKGDPKQALKQKPMERVFEALDYYEKIRVPKIRGGPAARTAIEKYLKPRIGDRRIQVMTGRDFLTLSDDLQSAGLSLAYASRVLSVARAAFKLAKEDGKIAMVPPVPEIRGEEEIEAEDLRGRELEIAEVAVLFDAITEAHFLNYQIHVIHTGARPEAILEATTAGIDWKHGIFELNPKGRKQTKKRRPIVRIAATWRPWLEALREGPIVTYNGQAVKSVKTAMRATVRRSGLSGRVNATSIRHTIGRFLENEGVPGREISILLGHTPVHKKKSTRRYSPADPLHQNYLVKATPAIEKFVKLVNQHTTRWDLERPGTIKLGWKRK